MNDSRHFQIPALEAKVEDKTSEISQSDVKPSATLKGWNNQTLLENNPKIDLRLVEENERLAAASKGVVRITRGANYRLSHPLGSNDVPNDGRRSASYLSKPSKKS